VHEGGDIGDQLHGSGQGVGASGARGCHSLLQGLHYHLHKPLDVSDTRGVDGKHAGQCVTTEPLTKPLAGGFNDDKHIWHCRFCVMTCTSGIATQTNILKDRNKPGRDNTQRCCYVPRHVVCGTAEDSDSAVDLAKHSWSEHWCLGQSFAGLPRSQLAV